MYVSYKAIFVLISIHLWLGISAFIVLMFRYWYLVDVVDDDKEEMMMDIWWYGDGDDEGINDGEIGNDGISK